MALWACGIDGRKPWIAAFLLEDLRPSEPAIRLRCRSGQNTTRSEYDLSCYISRRAVKFMELMKTQNFRLSVIAIVCGLLSGGCADMSPGENAAVFGAVGGAAAGGIARAAGMSTRGSVLTGMAAGAVIGAVTYVIAKRQATERQRRIAEMRARRTYAAMSTKRKQEMKEKKVRYIAVDTEKDERTSPKAQKSVMIWDTESQQVVGNNVYDVKEAPEVGSTAKFETYSAEYVGSGT
jgi:gas vesicle protein